MARIIKKEHLSDLVVRLRLDAPRIARKRRAGQFVILRSAEMAERIPLTIANADAGGGWIEIIFQVVGHATRSLAALDVGGEILDLAGPLGKPTHIEKAGRCVCIGGGVGIAPLFPIVQALHGAGNDIVTIIGARNAGLLILEDDLSQISSELHVATDDGSKGTKGFVSTVLDELLSQEQHFDLAVVIGPVPMMKFTSQKTVAAGIPTTVSLNPIMIDGTGMCGGCRVSVHGETKFACVDGPEFDGAGVDWDGLISRLRTYTDHEHKNHECKLSGV